MPLQQFHVEIWCLVKSLLGLYEQQQSEDEGDKEGVNMAEKKG
jgi:hypothetical protein